MRFPIEIYEAAVPQLLERLMQITGAEPWTKRCEWLAREVAENRHMDEWLQERCSLEWEFRNSIQSGDLLEVGRYRVHNAARYELAAFAAGVTQIYERLSSNGRNRLRGVLLDGLKEDKGLLSVQHEIATAVHLVQLGFDVDFHDLESGGGFDFLAKRGDVEVEVECKMFSTDIGRKIHRRLSKKLFKVLEPTLNHVFQTATRGLLVRITLPARLTPALQQHEGIRRSVERGLLVGNTFHSEYCDVNVRDFAIEGSPFDVNDISKIQEGAVAEFVAVLSGQRNPMLMMLISPGRGVVIALLESSQPDAVLEGIRRQLRDGAKGQFSGVRPACLVAQIHGLDEEQMRSLAESDSSTRENAHGLQIMTSDFLQSPTRAHIHSVIYRARPIVVSKAGAISSPSSTYVMRNASHPLANDPTYSVFGPTTAAGPRIVLSS